MPYQVYPHKRSTNNRFFSSLVLLLSAESISPDEYDDTSDSLRTLSYYLDKTQLSEEHEMDHLQRMSQRYLYQDNQHANKKHSMVGQRTGNFSKQELNDTRKDRMGLKKKNKGLRPLSSGLRSLSSNSTKELRPLSSGLSSNSTNSTKGLRPLSSNSTYAQVPARYLSRSYSDSTTGTDAVNVNRFAENAKKRVRITSRILSLFIILIWHYQTESTKRWYGWALLNIYYKLKECFVEKRRLFAKHEKDIYIPVTHEEWYLHTTIFT